MQIHLAILHKHYLSKILAGEKTIESRFTKVKCLPHGRVGINDLIFLKQTAGDIVATAYVDNVIYFENLSSDDVNQILNKYNDKIKLGDDFLQKALSSKYCTLIILKQVTRLKPFAFSMKGRSGWYIVEKDSVVGDYLLTHL